MSQLNEDIAGPAYRLTQIRIAKAIRKMAPGKNRLPTEEELARILGVSRSTVREAVHRLVIEGMVTKRHGRGAFGHPAVANLPFRLDRNLDIQELLKYTGRQLEISITPVELTAPSQRMIRRVPECSDQQVFRWEAMHTLDGEMAILIVFEIPEAFFVQVPETSGVPMSVRDFLKECTNRDPSYFISWIVAESRPEVRERFDWGEEVMQNWEELFYDLQDTPICFAELFFNPGLMDVAVVTAL